MKCRFVGKRGRARPRVGRGPWLVLGLAVLELIGVVSCSRASAGAAGSAQRPPVPVTVAEAVVKDMPVEIRAIARVEPRRTATLKAQVTGEITATHFREGQDVDAGDLLFSIDARSYEAALRQAEGTLAKDTALSRDADIEAKRQTDLHDQGVATQREYETAIAAAAALAGTVKADQAAVESARLQVEYCSIRAPFAGRTGSWITDVGNVVKADETQLVTLNELSPIYVDFSVAEQYLEDIRKYHAGGTLAVEAEVPQSRGPREHGELTFIDNRVDATTGMIMLKATFANEDRRLWPGQFVNAILTLTTRKDVVVVPSQAVQAGQTSQFVYIVKSDETAEVRPVEPGIVAGGETAIERGVALGERVVTDGQLRLTAGAKVQIRSSAGAGSQPSAESRP